jgi:lipoate-protein ligase A
VLLPVRTPPRLQAKKGEIVTFGGATREDDLSARRAGNGGDLLARLLDNRTGAASEIVRAAAGIAEAGFKMMKENFADARVDRRCGRAVEIYGSFAPFHACRMLLSLSVRLITISPENAAENLALDESLLGRKEEALRFWECAEPVVVMGRAGRIEEQVRAEACRADGVEVLRRGSGGGAVVLGPGCLNYSFVFSLDARPQWRNVGRSVREILSRIAEALGASICGSSDLIWEGRKVSGNSQRRASDRVLQHGTLLYRFDAELAARYLIEPARQPEYRRGRPHTEFLGNLPHSPLEIQRRVADIWAPDIYS